MAHIVILWRPSQRATRLYVRSSAHESPEKSGLIHGMNSPERAVLVGSQ